MNLNLIARNVEPITYVTLHGKYWTIAEILQCVRFQLSEGWNLFEPGQAYLARELCGHAFWSLLDHAEKLIVGSCISHLMKSGELPLIKISSRPNRFNVDPKIFLEIDPQVWALPAEEFGHEK